jgi:hypothetical protein
VSEVWFSTETDAWPSAEAIGRLYHAEMRAAEERAMRALGLNLFGAPLRGALARCRQFAAALGKVAR